MRMNFYTDTEANEVASRFFKDYYQDRGIKKWGGFFLSEHSAALKKLVDQEHRQGA